MRKNATAKALIMSVLSLMLCLSMLVGTTFAWFTDSVKSGVNKIVAGNLDVELYHSNGKVADEKVGTDTKLFVGKDGKDILWEPGVMVYENFTVKNVGTLALKYKLALNVSGFNTIDGKSLKDVLKVAVLENAFTGDRAAALALKYDSTIEDFVKDGTLTAGAEKTYAVVIYWEPSANDNDYNLNNGKVSSDGNPLFIDLGITLVAGQTPEEVDSFDKDYDQNAEYPVIESATDWYDKADVDATTFTIKTGSELAYIAELVEGGETFDGKIITLANDIVLPAGEWKAIGTFEKRFQGTFNGNGHTVSNVVIHDNDGSQPCGFFGAIENATIEDLRVSGTMTLDALQDGSEPGNGGANYEFFANGGICGFAENSTIRKCVNAINIDATNRTTGTKNDFYVTLGGILGCGSGSNMIVENCLNVGSIKVSTKAVTMAGGITAIAGNSGPTGVYTTLQNCVNAGSNNGENEGSALDAPAPGKDVSGSIVGMFSENEIENCYSVNGKTTIGMDLTNFNEDGWPQPSETGYVESATSLNDFPGLDTNIWEWSAEGYPVLK